MKKSRKRLLISSVAMLLVAMLALGTATFAWFTQATTARADNISATAEKASMLLLSKSSGAWTNHVDYNFSEDAMKPASTKDGSVWVTTNATDGSGVRGIDANGDPVAITTVTGDDDYVFTEELNVKNNGTIDYTNVYFTLEGFETSANDYACFALVSKATSNNTNATASKAVTAAGTFGAAPNSTYTTTGKIYQNAAETYNGLGADGTTASFSTGSCAANDFKIYVPNLAADKEAYYTLYVWFEGQDTDCKDAKSGQTIGDLVFKIHGTPAE